MKIKPLLSIPSIILIIIMNFPDAFLRMRFISNQSYIHPRGVETKMRSSFNATIKYQNKLWTKTLLERLAKKKVGTNEIVQFARNQARNSKEKEIYVFEKCIVENMKIKLTDAEEALQKAKIDMVQ